MSPGKGAAAASPSPTKSPNITRKGKKTPVRENTAFAPRTSKGEVVTEVFFQSSPALPACKSHALKMSLEHRGAASAGMRPTARRLREGPGSPEQATLRPLFLQKAPLRLPKAT